MSHPHTPLDIPDPDSSHDTVLRTSNGTSISLDNGQSCFWYSHGCTIYCDECDGVTARGKDTCPQKKKPNATICDPKLRTVNRFAECGSPQDHYYYNPWRAPGAAPVFDGECLNIPCS